MFSVWRNQCVVHSHAFCQLTAQRFLTLPPISMAHFDKGGFSPALQVTIYFFRSRFCCSFPGAPSATSGHPAAAHRPCHRGPAAKARSRARAAAYQATKAVAAATASLSPPLLWPLDQEELLLPLLLFSDDHCIFCLHHQLVVEG